MTALPDRKTIIAKIKETAGSLGNPHVTQAELQRHTGITRYQVYRRFSSHTALLQAAGLQTSANLRIPDDTLLRVMADVFRREKGVLTFHGFTRASPHSISAYLRRWGRWSSALGAFREWQEEHDPGFPYAEELTAPRPRGRPPGRRLQPSWSSLGGRHYGEALNFRGLLHAPVNEQGVLFLFATLAVDLGFLIEGLTLEYPDCEAKRRVGAAWERVRIEFEYQSRNFRNHRHDPEDCDLIVCWEHNWEKCPIEVLALKPLMAEALNGTLPVGSSVSHRSPSAPSPLGRGSG